jgi:hypothetical protein
MNALFSNHLTLGVKKSDDPCFYFGIGFYFWEKSANLIKICKIAFSTLKSAFGF